MSLAMAEEGKALVRRAAGDTSGMTVGAQIQKAAKALGYPAHSWRVREAWYGRAGCWSAQAMRDLQDAFTRWFEREQSRLDMQRQAQAVADRLLLEKLRDQHATELQRLNARLAFLDGGST